MQPIVKLDNVDVDIDGAPVLHRIALQIDPRRHWGIVGDNGSGKSTLLALIAGRRWPAPGRGSRVYDFGNGPERDAVTARECITLLGHELQEIYVARHWNFAARDIVRSGLTRTDIPQRNPDSAQLERARILLEALELGHLASRRFLSLSRGEQRRVLIARALGFEPALLLLDEPASGLDGRSRTGLDTTLRRATETTQLIIATHRLDELPDFITNTARISGGRLTIAPTAPQLAGNGPAADPESTAIRSPASVNTPRAGAKRRDSGSTPRVSIRLEQASIWLDGHRVLDSLDWTIRDHEHWLVTGANGAGKSTLLRLLHAELRPERGGSISWPGFGNPRDVWQLRRSIALVSAEFQARYRYPSSVFEAIASGYRSSIGLTHQLSDAETDRVRSLLQSFELEAFSERMISSLSYGQRHRTLIARTLTARPAMLLLDEPWEGMDDETSAIVCREIARCMAAGTQVICVSHVGPRGLPCNRTIALDKGRIQSIDAISADGSGALRENSSSERYPAQGSRRR